MVKYLIIIWTLLAIILNLCGVGTFATWDITARPWRWSCLCIFYWWFALYVFCYIIAAWRLAKARQAWDEAPEWVKHFSKRP